MPTLDEVYEEIREDPFWDGLRGSGIKMVPGFGSSRPKVLLVGEAPGATENARGRPFCGPSGKVLAQLMALAGLRLEDVPEVINPPSLRRDAQPANAFITNVVKYRPMGNRTPSLIEVLHAREGYKQRQTTAGFKEVIDDRLPEGAGSLRREWAALGGPRMVVCIGAIAHMAMSPMNHEALSRHVGRMYSRRTGEATVWFCSQYHPAYGMRNRGNQKLLDRIEQDWVKMGEFMREEGLL